MNPLLRSSAAHVFVGDIDHPMLDTDDLHHLARVLRLRAGSKVTCSDGVGGWRSCEFTGAALSPVEAPDRSTPPPTSHLFVAVPKGDRVDWLVQKATEVGVGRLTFVEIPASSFSGATFRVPAPVQVPSDWTQPPVLVQFRSFSM